MQFTFGGGRAHAHAFAHPYAHAHKAAGGEHARIGRLCLSATTSLAPALPTCVTRARKTRPRISPSLQHPIAPFRGTHRRAAQRRNL